MAKLNTFYENIIIILFSFICCLQFIFNCNSNGPEYFQTILKLFSLNPNNPNVCWALGEIFLQRDELDKADNLAKRGLQMIENLVKREGVSKDLKYLQSNLLLLQGKLLHVKEEYNKAFKYYDDAVNICDSNPVAFHYLGTINMHLKIYPEAEKNFEKALKLTKIDKEHASERHCVNVETMRILAEAKIRLMKRDDAIKILDTILENDRSDIDSYLKAAHLTEQFDYEKAINYYSKAIEFLEKKTTEARSKKQESNYSEDDFINPIYYNNIAVLYMKKEMKEEAKQMITKAKESLKAVRKIFPQSLTFKCLSITLLFNEACHFESLGEIAEATNIYKLIIKEEPYYVDAYLRLAILADKRGSLAKAIEYGEKAAKYQIDRKQVVPYCVLGNFYLKRNLDLKAEKEFSNAINKNPLDTYAHLSLGNIMYNEACRIRDNPKKQEDKLREAMKRYLKAMECDDSNAFAAICVANVIGEYGMIDEAMEIYRVIRENHSNFSHAMINSGHVLASEGQVANALKLFEKVLVKFYNGKNEQLELWIARLHYQSKNYDACQKVLTKLIHQNPANIIPKFNLALCLQSKSVEILNKDYREVKETRKTISDLNVAKNIFSSLIQSHSNLISTLPSNFKDDKLAIIKESHSRILKISDDRLFFIKDTLQSSDRYLEHDIQTEKRLKEQQEANLARIKEMELLEKLKKEEEIRQKEELQRERDLKAEESSRVIEEMARQWAEEENKKKAEVEEAKKNKN